MGIDRKSGLTCVVGLENEVVLANPLSCSPLKGSTAPADASVNGSCSKAYLAITPVSALSDVDIRNLA